MLRLYDSLAGGSRFLDSAAEWEKIRDTLDDGFHALCREHKEKSLVWTQGRNDQERVLNMEREGGTCNTILMALCCRPLEGGKTH